MPQPQIAPELRQLVVYAPLFSLQKQQTGVDRRPGRHCAIRSPMLQPEQMARLQQHLDQKAKASACVLCGEKSWTAIGPVSYVASPPPGVVMFTTPSVPVVLLACNHCHNTLTLLWAPIAREAGLV